VILPAFFNTFLITREQAFTSAYCAPVSFKAKRVPINSYRLSERSLRSLSVIGSLAVEYQLSLGICGNHSVHDCYKQKIFIQSC